MWESTEGNICSSILKFGKRRLSPAGASSSPDPLSIYTSVWVGGCSGAKTPISSPVPPDYSDLNPTAVHLDDLRSEGLDGSQDQLLVLQGRDSKAQHIPGGGSEEKKIRFIIIRC